MLNPDTWKFLAGLGFFLFAMNQLESILKKSSGRGLKLFLKQHTQNLFKSILGGTIVTTIVQSSSVVSLIVLAFVEAGIITFRNALGVILGSNLGTTLSNWIVATLGFKISILSYALPLLAISAIGMFMTEKRKKLHNFFNVFFSLGLLFLGLEFMKEGALLLVGDLDLSTFTRYGPLVFAGLGFVLSTLIHSSSASVAIILTGIYSGILPLYSAAAMVIGTEVGTTVKILFWGMRGSADKKRVAFGNFFYNIFSATVAFVSLGWLLYFIEHTIEIKDPLIALVFFQSMINTLPIFLFVPFIGPFCRLLEKYITRDYTKAGTHLRGNLPALPILATDTLRNETVNLLVQTLQFNKLLFDTHAHSYSGFFRNIQALAETGIDVEKEYSKLKQTEGTLLAYYANMQSHPITEENAGLMLQYANAARQCISSAKAVKDIRHNLREFLASTNDILYRQPATISSHWRHFSDTVAIILEEPDRSVALGRVKTAMDQEAADEQRQRQEVIRWLKKSYLTELEASTYLNVIKEMRVARAAVLKALAYLETENLKTMEEASEITT